MVLVQNYWLSAPYGRNWLYLWSSQHVPAWQMAILVAVFFLGVWAASLYLFSILSSRHSWILPIFAIGLGAPRWCQMLWSTSNIGQYVPWAGGHAASAFAGRTLWLWLGVLDALQGVGKYSRIPHVKHRINLIIRLRDDPPQHPHSLPHCFHRHRRPSHRFRRYNPGTSYRPQQDRTWGCLSRFFCGLYRWSIKCLVLDCPVFPTVYQRHVFLLLQEGATG